MNKADNIISKLGLRPHVEGGFFTETYRSPYVLKSEDINHDFEGQRPLASSIYYLLKSGQKSKFHNLKFDEQWFFHFGSPLFIHLINDDGKYEIIKFGANIVENEKPYFLVKAGVVLGAEVVEDNSFCLVSCVVTPGFDYRDFKLFDSEVLINKFPQHEQIIKKLNG